MAPQPITCTLLLLLAAWRIDFVQSGMHDHKMKSPQKILLQGLLERYGETSVPPVINQSEPVVMNIRFFFQRMVSFEQSKQALEVTVNSEINWRDEYLTWDPAEHNGVDLLFVPVEKIWTFDLTLFTSVGASVVEMDHRIVIVRPDGMVTWFSNAVIRSSCLVRVHYFPFDKQYCSLVLASWAYNNNLVTINGTEGTMSEKYFITNDVWDVLSIEEKNLQYTRECCPNDSWSEVHYLLIFERQSSYYVFTVILPGTALSLVSLLVFFMPPDSEEKVTLASSNLLAMLLFQELVSTSMPPIGNQFPLIGSFFVAAIVISNFSIFVSLLIRFLHNKDNRPVPKWLRKLTMLETSSNQIQPVHANSNWVERRLSSLISTSTVSKAVSERHRPNASLGANSLGSKYGEPLGVIDEPRAKANENVPKTDDDNAEGVWCRLGTRVQIVAQWHEVALKVNRLMAFLLTGAVVLTGLVITVLYITQEEKVISGR